MGHQRDRVLALGGDVPTTGRAGDEGRRQVLNLGHTVAHALERATEYRLPHGEAVGLGLLNFNQVWVNPTYLWSGILGGLIMGVGFIVGGFCPTTSLASASTGKIDGMLFMLGGFVGAFLFGETERYFTNWYNNAGYLGRLDDLTHREPELGGDVARVVDAGVGRRRLSAARRDTRHQVWRADL